MITSWRRDRADRSLQAPPAATEPAPLGAVATTAAPGQQARLLLSLFEHSASGLLLCDPDGRVRLCSPVAAELLGTVPAQVQGRPVGDWVAPLIDFSVADAEQGLPVGQWETQAQRADGTSFPAELTVSDTPLDGRPGRVLFMRDITDRRLNQQRLSALANFDGLTGLPNRMQFRDLLTQAMARARRSGVLMALMFLDLDDFKAINDTLGHGVGDELLRQVAARLQACVRGPDPVLRREGPGADAPSTEGFTVSRLGGDEFTVIAENLSGANAAVVLARRILEAMTQPVQIEEHQLHVGTSIGIAMYPFEDTDLDRLVRQADSAMYRAKTMGKGTYAFYSDELTREVAARLKLEGELRRALEQQEFALCYQPLARLDDGRITGVEALLRWNPPGGGTVPPDRFIRVLEDSGLILQVGHWALRTACAEMAAMRRQGLPRMSLSVNFSARQFRQPNLLRLIAATLAETGFEPSSLEIEITERLLVEDHEATRVTLEGLAHMGVRVAIDDFGTGYSSLSYLKRFDIDTLKIDGSFVAELPGDPDGLAIAAAIVALGHSLQMRVVAERVETPEQAQCLRAMGCDGMQGYVLCGPLPGAALRNWLREHGRSGARTLLGTGATEGGAAASGS
ncbi:MAG: putative bifunctional diguanylate cyclase/phosphodiesterase [Betaproteobacteria bacterium]